MRAHLAGIQAADWLASPAIFITLILLEVAAVLFAETSAVPTRPRAPLQHPPQCPASPRQEGSGRAAATALASAVMPGAASVSFALLLMAISTASRCEIRALVMHVYPGGIKAYDHEHFTIFVGRRGKPVRKLRNMPIARALELARKLQGSIGTMVTVA